MQKMRCYTIGGSEPILEFESTCLPRIKDKMLINYSWYVVKQIQHKFKLQESHYIHEIDILVD